MQTAKDIELLLKKEFGKKFLVEFQKRFEFDGTHYRPDVIICDKKSRSIKAIIEIEQCSRKHVVGGVITADYCMRKEGEKPIMCVLSLNDQNTEGYRNRLKMLKHYIKSFKKIIIGNKKDIIKALGRIK